LVVNDSLALRRAIETGAGVGMAPDYAMSNNPYVKQVLRDVEMPTLDSYRVFPRRCALSPGFRCSETFW
jgi:DNA-binding transcriptional LysR family regulator